MSKRFIKWAETSIEEIPPGAHPDIESCEPKAKRLAETHFAEADAAGFRRFGCEEERARVLPLVLAVSDRTDLAIDAYRLKLLPAQEDEDGD